MKTSFGCRKLGFLVLSALATFSCSQESPTEPLLPTPVAEARQGGPKGGDKGGSGFSVLSLGVLAGHDGGSAMAVNDAGLVVGLSKVQGTSGEAVMWVGSQIYALTPDDHLPGSAEAVGEGATTVFIGGTALYEDCTRAARWRVDLSGAAPSIQLTILPGAGGTNLGSVRGINDQGDAVGYDGSEAILWPVGGGRTVIAAPSGSGFTSGAARDINNAGLIVAQFSNREAPVTRAYLRLAAGTFVPLAPAPGDRDSYAGGVSEVLPDGTVVVAGTTGSGTGDVRSFRAVRWRVAAESGDLVSVEIMGESSSSGSVSNAGVLAGALEGQQSDKAAIWPTSEAVVLPLSKGLNDGAAWGISASGQYVAGQGRSMRAVRPQLWTAKK